MSQSLNRILAIALKEWRLNLRFPIEFFIGTFISPLKSALLMCLLYSGFLKASNSYIGNVTQENFLSYILLGTVLHSQLSSSVNVFRGRMLTEKYWQTATATLMTPTTVAELIAGFMIGSGGATLLVNSLILSAIAIMVPVGFDVYLFSLLVLFLVAMLGFGLGMLGATIGLCWEGKSFLFDYSVQAITFLSCFYYPIELLPTQIRSVVQLMPTFKLSNCLHELYIANSTHNVFLILLYMVTVCAVVAVVSGVFFDRSIRKHGITGY